MPARLNLIGRKFGRLTVEKLHHIYDGYSYWVCTCICGNQKIARGTSLTNTKTTSCGCAHIKDLSCGTCNKAKTNTSLTNFYSWIKRVHALIPKGM